MFKFNCPSCQKILTGTEELRCRLAQCLFCRATLRIPSEANVAVTAQSYAPAYKPNVHVCVADGNLRIDISLDDIVAIIEESNEYARKKGNKNLTRVTDKEAFGRYLAGYLMKADSFEAQQIADLVDEAVGRTIDDAEYMGAGLRAITGET